MLGQAVVRRALVERVVVGPNALTCRNYRVNGRPMVQLRLSLAVETKSL
jgi:hypothetical protein